MCPRKANAMSKTVKYEVDLAEPAVADGCPQQAERKALAANA